MLGQPPRTRRSSAKIRDAVAPDCEALTALCIRSKASWGYDERFMRQSREALSVTPAKLARWNVRVAESSEGALLGVSAFSLGAHGSRMEAELELLFVEPAQFGRGVGRLLMDDVRALLRGRGVDTLWILSDPGAEPFYRSVGAVHIGVRPSAAVSGRNLPWLRLALSDTAQALTTSRLLLRAWREADLAPFAAINADERVAQYLPAPLEREQSDALALRIQLDFERHGFGLWAVERSAEPCQPFIGFIGLAVTSFRSAFTPSVEIAWRLAASQWGTGLATEGARAVVRDAFQRLRLDELVSFTVPQNLASRRVMEKLGMQRDASEDFEHPALPNGHPLRRHVLYRLRSR